MRNFQKKIDLIIVLMVAFIDWVGIGLVYPLFSSMVFDTNFPLISEEASDTERGIYLGLLLAALSITQFFSSPILGTLSDYKGRKKILMRSLTIGVLGYALAIFAVIKPSLSLLIISRLIIGISTGSAAIVSASIADLSPTPQKKTKNFALYNMACGVGFAIGPFLGGKLSQRGFEPITGFAFPFLIAGLVLMANILLILFFYKETHFIKKEKKITLMQGVHNLKKAFHFSEFQLLFLTTFFFAFGWSFFYEFIPVTWIKRYQLDAQGVGSLYAYAAAIYALCASLLIRPIINRFKLAPTLFYALAIQGVYILIFLIPMDFNWLWIYIPPQQFLGALAFPILQSLISSRTSDDMQGEILGIMQSVLACGFILSPLISGPLLGITTDMPMYVGGISFILAAFIMSIFLQKEKDTPKNYEK